MVSFFCALSLSTFVAAAATSRFAAEAAAAATSTRPWYLEVFSSGVVYAAIEARKNNVSSQSASSVANHLVEQALDLPQATSIGSLLIQYWAENGPTSINPTELLSLAKVAATGYSSVEKLPGYPSYVAYAKSEATIFDFNQTDYATLTGAADLRATEAAVVYRNAILKEYASLDANPSGHLAIETLVSVFNDYYRDFGGASLTLGYYIANKLIDFLT